LKKGNGMAPINVPTDAIAPLMEVLAAAMACNRNIYEAGTIVRMGLETIMANPSHYLGTPSPTAAITKAAVDEVLGRKE
jgi:hypothetical protein